MSLVEELQKLNMDIRRRNSDNDNKLMKLFNMVWALKNNDSLIVKYAILTTTRNKSLSDYENMKKEFWNYQFGLKKLNEEFLERGGRTLEEFELKEKKYLTKFYDFIEESYKTLEKEVKKL